MSTLNFSKLRLNCERCQLCDPRYRDGRCIEDWKLTHQAIHDENELIGQRVNWLSLRRPSSAWPSAVMPSGSYLTRMPHLGISAR